MLRSGILLTAAFSLIAASVHAQGTNNLYLGTGAGNPGVSTGDRNTALGEFALSSNTSGSDNTAVGSNACFANTIGAANTGVGSNVLVSNTTGFVNTAVGAGAMSSNTNGSGNTALGVDTLNSNTSGGSNTAIGFQAMSFNISGQNNTALGTNALGSNTGSSNIAIGFRAGFNLNSGSNNIHIGNNPPANESNTIRIGSTQTAAFLAGVNGATAPGGVQVFVDASGKLGTVTSSKRFKEDVQDMGEASDDLMRLRPVTFHYKAAYDDGSRLLQYGLIAEEVAAVAPDLVQFDAKGQPFTVRYHAINAMLLNELQKQHAKVEEQEAELARQKSQIESQEARIRRLERLLARQDAER